MSLARVGNNALVIGIIALFFYIIYLSMKQGGGISTLRDMFNRGRK